MSDRSITAAALNAIDASVVRPAFLVFFDFPSGAVYAWTGQGTLSHGGNDYLGMGSLLGFGSIAETADTTANGLEVTLSGIDSNLLSDVINDEYQGAAAQVDLALLDEDLNVIPDPINEFKGLLDKATVRDTGKTSVISLQIESRLVDILRPRQWRYTDADQQLLHPGAGDKAFEFVPKIQNVNIQWGG